MKVHLFIILVGITTTYVQADNSEEQGKRGGGGLHPYTPKQQLNGFQFFKFSILKQSTKHACFKLEVYGTLNRSDQKNES